MARSDTRGGGGGGCGDKTRAVRPATRPRQDRPQGTIRPGTSPRHGSDTADLGTMRAACARRLGLGMHLVHPTQF